MGGWQRLLMIGMACGAVLAATVAAIGLFIVPGGASIPVHAGVRGFDGFAPRNRGLITLTLLPLLVGGALFLGYWSRQDSVAARSLVAIVGFVTMVILVVFNVQAIRYGLGQR